MLATRNLTFAYPNDPARPIFRALDLELPGSSLTAIIGPNGAGKSTLLRLLAGVMSDARHATGDITLAGRILGDISLHERATRLAYMAQRGSASLVAFDFTVRAVCALGLHGRTFDPGAVHRVLERLDLVGEAGRVVHELSAGQQQRVSFARALVQLEHQAPESRVLLADEPISAMDPRHALATMRELKSIARAGGTVGVVLHDVTTVLRHADRVIALSDHGDILAQGSTHDVLEEGSPGQILERLYHIPFVHFGESRSRGAWVPADVQ
ncbi:MAG: ABC transporter ATP-binding protein [Phycisphaerales bacterium]|nr:MAG: ABC transporter ATP-binding protein [Phycisphaerales bacterium]